tara:strand:+ start:46026 stop:48233 length:2208 start_codon:yes stop_codon:yes gene_type:complete
MKIKKFFFLFFTLIFSSSVFPSIDDYIYPFSGPTYNEYGALGLIRMPSARFHEAGTIAINWSTHDPYTRGAFIGYPFSWMEASWQYTDVNNALYSDVEAFSGKQTYKDKGFDVKFRLLPESSYLPSIAMGIRDIAGTGTFAAEYIVASKYIDIPSKLFLSNYVGTIDLSFGLGWGDLSHNNFKNPLINIDPSFEDRTFIQDTQGGDFSPGRYFSGPMGAFAGLEIPIPNFRGLTIKIEYDGTNYAEEGFAFGKDSFSFAFKPVKPSQSRINAGFTLPINNHVNFYGAFTKGNTISFGITLKGGFGKKNNIVPKRDSYVPIKDNDIYKELATGNDELLLGVAMSALKDQKIYLQKMNKEDDVLTVLYAQNKYFSHGMALGRATRALNEVVPDEITTFKLENINAGMMMNSIEVDRNAINKYEKDKIYNLAANHIKISSGQYDQNGYNFNPPATYPNYFWSLEPDLRSQIGGPDGFYFGDLRVAFASEIQFRRNLSLITHASIGVYNNFDELKLASDSILPHVRTDVVKYLQATKDFGIKRIQLNYFKNPHKDIYAKVSLGMLEEMFGGIGAEILWRPMNRSYAIGAEIWSVKQRDYDMQFKFLDYETTTGHINFYYREPLSKITFAMKGGKFLAGDSGINFDFSRRFESGLRMGAFFSLTDISKREFGEGSFDKGFYFTIPIQAFYSNYSRKLAAWGLKPVTRDGAAYLLHSHHLWGLTEPAQRYGITRDLDDLYD